MAQIGPFGGIDGGTRLQAFDQRAEGGDVGAAGILLGLGGALGVLLRGDVGRVGGASGGLGGGDGGQVTGDEAKRGEVGVCVGDEVLLPALDAADVASRHWSQSDRRASLGPLCQGPGVEVGVGCRDVISHKKLLGKWSVVSDRGASASRWPIMTRSAISRNVPTSDPLRRRLGDWLPLSGLSIAPTWNDQPLSQQYGKNVSNIVMP